MDYEDIQLRLISECDTTAFDLVNISAHFIPSCSDVHIAAPADQWLLNTKADTVSNERYLKVTMMGLIVSKGWLGKMTWKSKLLPGSTGQTAIRFMADLPGI